MGSGVPRKRFLAAGILSVAILGLVALYAHFFWGTQRWTNFNPDYLIGSGAQTSDAPLRGQKWP